MIGIGERLVEKKKLLKILILIKIVIFFFRFKILSVKIMRSFLINLNGNQSFYSFQVDFEMIHVRKRKRNELFDLSQNRNSVQSTLVITRMIWIRI